ncbi:hypothetical protein [Williamsia sp.]|uniref:hypothetical protein n=1 Tax=Williamsia sp. TaxID=1872085 RepID=UPI002F950BFA
MTSRYDRTGDRIEDTDDGRIRPPAHDPRCDNGWLGIDDEMRPIPCLQCRPHLARGLADTNDFGRER